MKFRRQASMIKRASARGEKISPLRGSSPSLALKFSRKPFSHGLPGPMYAVFAPAAAIHACTAVAINLGPLSERTCSGTSRVLKRSDSTSMTSIASRFSFDKNGDALVRDLIDDIEHAKLPLLMGAIFDEVVRPDRVAPFCPKSDAGSVVAPYTAAFWLLLRNLQSLLPPDPFDPLVVHDPASRRSQQDCDLPVALAAVLPGRLDDVGGQPFFVIIAPRPLALR